MNGSLYKKNIDWVNLSIVLEIAKIIYGEKMKQWLPEKEIRMGIDWKKAWGTFWSGSHVPYLEKGLGCTHVLIFLITH